MIMISTPIPGTNASANANATINAKIITNSIVSTQICKRCPKLSFALLFGTVKRCEQTNSRHFKQHYAGIPTKQAKKIGSQIVAASELKKEGILKRYSRRQFPTFP